MRVEQCSIEDLDLSCLFFEKAIEFQKQKGGPSYKFVDRQLFQEDIEAGRQHKIINDRNEVVFLFTLWENDEHIWIDKQEDAALYLHRLLVNPGHRGQGHFKQALDWIEIYAYCKSVNYLRLDTLADSEGLTQLYEKHGFHKVGFYRVPTSSEASQNSQGNHVVLLERELQTGALYFANESYIENAPGFKSRSKSLDKWKVIEVTIEDSFVEEDWCNKTHLGYVTSGKLEVLFNNGDSKLYQPGKILWIAENNSHKATSKTDSIAHVLLFEHGVG
ncbi:MAG: hypothetical protein CL840_00335 [Crocinitomicaceae bacterium]|nr:hypothetical protein [Crocinitomicaceae bacterium]|tara:strand:- start:3043 stop:3867 length:825 start_codon:yes stop_codon:yes gene_type:complete